MKYLLLLLLACSIYSCRGVRKSSRTTYKWDTIEVSRPVAVSIAHDSIRLWDLDLGMIDTVIRSGRAKLEITKGSSIRRKNLALDCVPDTIQVPVRVKIPVLMPSQMNCSPDEVLLEARRSQGRSEGAGLVFLLLLVLYALKNYLKKFLPWLP